MGDYPTLCGQGVTSRQRRPGKLSLKKNPSDTSKSRRHSRAAIRELFFISHRNSLLHTRTDIITKSESCQFQKNENNKR